MWPAGPRTGRGRLPALAPAGCQVPVVQERGGEHQRQQVEEVVVPRDDDQDLQQHLGVEGGQAQAANGGEEQRRDRDLDDEGAHRAEPVQPDGQVVGEPGGRCRDALCLIVVGERSEPPPRRAAAGQLDYA